jgi:O-methyltransferase
MITFRSLVRRAALIVPHVRLLRERLLQAEARATDARVQLAAETVALSAATAEAITLRSKVTELDAECGAVTQLLLAAERERDLLAAQFVGAESVPAVLLARLDERADSLARDMYATTNTLERRAQIEADRVIARIAEFELRLEMPGGTAARGGSTALYLDLLEASLSGVLQEDDTISPWTDGYDRTVRVLGRDWPATAATMIGIARMRNLRLLVERVLAEGIPGDLIETGVWRGGACIYMRGVLAAHGDATRRVFVADSFRGLPPPDPSAYPADTDDEHHKVADLAVSRAEVEANFRRYGLLDERVVFLEGWFRDTLPAAPIERLAVLRLDGDMYESTKQALDALYHKVSPGGFVIVDDYVLKPCAQAVDEFRARHGIQAPLRDVDGAAVWWRVGEDSALGISG